MFFLTIKNASKKEKKFVVKIDSAFIEGWLRRKIFRLLHIAF